MSMRSARMYAAAVPTMPPGLVELMEGLAKDVLENSPDNIYLFCAQHMKMLIEKRDGKARNNAASPSIEKMLRAQEKKTILNDTEIAAVKTNDVSQQNINEIECDEKRIQHSDENSLYDNHDAEKKVEIEQNQFQLEGNTFDLNETTNFESEGDKDRELQLKISPEIKEEMLHSISKSFEEKSLVKSLSNENLASSITSNELGDLNESIACTTGIENENTLLTSESVSKDENQQQPTKSFDSATNSQYVDQTKDNLNHISNVDTAKSLQKDSSESEVINELNNDQDGSINDLSIQNDDCEATDNLSHEIQLNVENSNETKYSSEERSADVNNEAVNPMDLEKAAITIQKVFRAFLFKSKTLSTDEVTNIDLNYLVENEKKEAGKENKERRSGISRMDTVLQTVNEEKSLSLSTDDSSTLSSAATIIQAHVRGFLVRCKLPFNKTISTVSVLDSDIPSTASFDTEQKPQANKTILNIHIVPEGNNLISRDESLITSLDLSLDGSPRHSSNLHPLGYDRSERRKQLKREDAIQSVTPPSNNSGKLSEEVDSVKEVALNGSTDEPNLEASEKGDYLTKDDDLPEFDIQESEIRVENTKNKFKQMSNVTSDEADVVTPFTTDGPSVDSVKSTSKLLHSGEFHDIVLPTIVSRNNSSVVRGE